MPGPGERVRRVAAELRQGEHFAEKDFYLEEFRGRSVLVAVAPGVTDLGRLASALADLVRNDTRVLLRWSDLTPAAQRRLRGGSRSSTPTCSTRCSARARRSGQGSATAGRCWSRCVRRSTPASTP